MNDKQYESAMHIISLICWILCIAMIFFGFFSLIYKTFWQPPAAQAETTEQTVRIRKSDTPLQPLPEPQPQSIGEFKTTAYCSCEKCCGKWAKCRPTDEQGNAIVYTASGTVAEAGRTIAVDPSIIPYGTTVVIDGHTYIAEDCGGAIKGNRIDVYFDNHADALEWGVQSHEVSIIN